MLDVPLEWYLGSFILSLKTPQKNRKAELVYGLVARFSVLPANGPAIFIYVSEELCNFAYFLFH